MRVAALLIFVAGCSTPTTVLDTSPPRVVVVVESVHVGPIVVGGVATPNDYLQRQLRITNTDAGRLVRLPGLNAGPAPRLTDNRGNSYRPEKLPGVAAETRLDPGQSVADLIVFEVPVAGAGPLNLKIPGASLGGGGDYFLSLPAR